MTTNHPNPLAVTDEVERQIASDFSQRGLRLLPLTQADIDSARGRADAQLRAVAARELGNGARLNKVAQSTNRYVNRMQLSKALIDALNRRRA
jgi:hypothetical protein